MTSVIQSDIFFFVTTIAVLVFTVMGIVLFVYAMKIVSNVRHLSEKTRIEGDFLLDQMSKAREKIKAGTFGFRSLSRIIRRIITRYKQ